MKIICMIFAFSIFALPMIAEESDKELERLEKQMHDLRLKIMQSEVQSQSYIKYEWHDYTQEIQEAEKNEKSLKAVEEEYNKLLKQKEASKQNR